MKARVYGIKIAIAGTLCCVALDWGHDYFLSTIPEHFAAYGLTYPDWMLLLWMPISVVLLRRYEIPHRWWCCFGLLSFLLSYPFLNTFIQHGIGRRPWVVVEERYTVFAILCVYFCAIPPLVAMCCRPREQGGARA